MWANPPFGPMGNPPVQPHDRRATPSWADLPASRATATTANGRQPARIHRHRHGGSSPMPVAASSARWPSRRIGRQRPELWWSSWWTCAACRRQDHDIANYLRCLGKAVRVLAGNKPRHADSPIWPVHELGPRASGVGPWSGGRPSSWRSEPLACQRWMKCRSGGQRHTPGRRAPQCRQTR